MLEPDNKSIFVNTWDTFTHNGKPIIYDDTEAAEFSNLGKTHIENMWENVIDNCNEIVKIKSKRSYKDHEPKKKMEEGRDNNKM